MTKINEQINVVILVIVFIIFLFMVINKYQDNYPIKSIQYESTCRIQDNYNYSHWCNYPCTNNINEIIEYSTKCKI